MDCSLHKQDERQVTIPKQTLHPVRPFTIAFKTSPLSLHTPHTHTHTPALPLHPVMKSSQLKSSSPPPPPLFPPLLPGRSSPLKGPGAVEEDPKADMGSCEAGEKPTKGSEDEAENEFIMD